MSTKTVTQKLLIKPDTRYWISDDSQRDLIQPIPDGAERAETPADATVALFFAGSESSLREVMTEHQEHLTRPGIVWVAYPKGNKADINRDSVWPIMAEFGLRPNGQVAVDDVWSALRFRPLKEGEEQFTGGKKPGSTT